MGDRASNSRPFQRRAAQRSIISEARKAIGQCHRAGLQDHQRLDMIQVFVGALELGDERRVNVALRGSVATEQVGALALKGLTLR